jgi:glycerol-3-phosphate acyltransferase PlsY
VQETFLIVAGYLLGSLSSAIIVSHLMGLPDPRTQGSGNPGATNVLRTGGKKAAAITLLGDLLKGLIPVLIAKWMGASLEVQLLVAGAAFLGHLYPVFFRFAGGKGVATAAGILMGLDWRIGLAALGTWLLIFKLKKISSLSALTATALTPLYIWLITGSGSFTLFGILLAALVFWRHRSNIRKLLDGTEG